jgi:tRNA threonylcarbamoyladenosine biosynthesis protein TsaB
VIALSEKNPEQLKGVIVAAGPGSYTGLRIGVATAKGICYALKIPLVSINTLELLAYQFKFSTTPSPLERGPGGEVLLCPMLDARRMEVYCMLLDSNLVVKESTQAKIIDAESFADKLAIHKVYFFGDGAMKCKELIKHEKAHFISGLIPSAVQLGELGFKKWKTQQIEDVASFEPYYLKEFMIKKPNLA